MDKTIIMASHLLDEVQKVCSHFAVMQRGKRIYAGSVAGALYNTSSVVVSADNMDALWSALETCPGVTAKERNPEIVRVDLTEGWSASKLNTFLTGQGVPVNYIQQKKSSLEEKFLALLKESDDSLITTTTQHA
jgi:ABC-2 type transport system ATP-binding protein